MQHTGQQAVQAIAESGNYEHYQCPKIAPLHQMNHDERNKNHPQQSELVGSGEELRRLHAPSFAACDLESSSLPLCCSRLEGASTAEGSSPVLAKKRWESDGRLPSGRSSSTRSMRCMGKK